LPPHTQASVKASSRESKRKRAARRDTGLRVGEIAQHRLNLGIESTQVPDQVAVLVDPQAACGTRYRRVGVAHPRPQSVLDHYGFVRLGRSDFLKTDVANLSFLDDADTLVPAGRLESLVGNGHHRRDSRLPEQRHMAGVRLGPPDGDLTHQIDGHGSGGNRSLTVAAHTLPEPRR